MAIHETVTHSAIRSGGFSPGVSSMMLIALALFFAAGTLASCASEGGNGLASRSDYATLVLENDSPTTVTVYALRSGSRQRIGTVTGLSTEEFAIRRDHLGAGGQLRVGIDPVGSSRLYTSDSITVTEGDVIELTVSAFLR